MTHELTYMDLSPPKGFMCASNNTLMTHPVAHVGDLGCNRIFDEQALILKNQDGKMIGICPCCKKRCDDAIHQLDLEKFIHVWCLNNNICPPKEFYKAIQGGNFAVFSQENFRYFSSYLSRSINNIPGGVFGYLVKQCSLLKQDRSEEKQESSSHLAIFKFLFESSKSQSTSGLTAAIEQGNLPIIQYCLTKFQKPSLYFLFFAAKSSSPALNFLLKQPPYNIKSIIPLKPEEADPITKEHLNNFFWPGWTLLHFVVRNLGEYDLNTSVNLIRFLLNKDRTLIHAKDQKDATPLHYCLYTFLISVEDQNPAVELLIKANANVNETNIDGDTILHILFLVEDSRLIANNLSANDKSRLTTFLLNLLKAGIDVNIRNKMGKTAFDLANSNSILKTFYLGQRQLLIEGNLPTFKQQNIAIAQAITALKKAVSQNNTRNVREEIKETNKTIKSLIALCDSLAQNLNPQSNIPPVIPTRTSPVQLLPYTPGPSAFAIPNNPNQAVTSQQWFQEQQRLLLLQQQQHLTPITQSSPVVPSLPTLSISMQPVPKSNFDHDNFLSAIELIAGDIKTFTLSEFGKKNNLDFSAMFHNGKFLGKIAMEFLFTKLFVKNIQIINFDFPLVIDVKAITSFLTSLFNNFQYGSYPNLILKINGLKINLSHLRLMYRKINRQGMLKELILGNITNDPVKGRGQIQNIEPVKSSLEQRCKEHGISITMTHLNKRKDSPESKNVYEPLSKSSRSETITIEGTESGDDEIPQSTSTISPSLPAAPSQASFSFNTSLTVFNPHRASQTTATAVRASTVPMIQLLPQTKP